MGNGRRRTLAVAACALLLFSCATPQQNEALGGLGGGLAGGLICAAAGGGTGACVASAVGGAVLGWGAVKLSQKAQQDRPADKESLYYGYDPSQGTVVAIRAMRVKPEKVKAGGTVDVETEYSLLVPKAEVTPPLRQTFSVWKDGEELHAYPPAELPSDPGGWTVAQEISIPAGAKPGLYEVKQVLDANDAADFKGTAFMVVQ
jgi:hypothetical protein